jgi:hypothetical protein
MATFVKETRRTPAHGASASSRLLCLFSVAQRSPVRLKQLSHHRVIWSRKRARPPGQVIRSLPCDVDHKALCAQLVGEMQRPPASS